MDGVQRQLAATHSQPTGGALVAALACGLTLIVVLTKFALLPFPVHTAGQFVRWLLRLAIVSSADVAFVAALALTFWALYQPTCSRPNWRRVWRGTTIAAFQLAGLYAVASIVMFRVTLRPLSIQLLSFSGGPRLMASSLTGFLTWDIVAGGLAVIVGAAVVALRARRDTPRDRCLSNAPRHDGTRRHWAWTAACFAAVTGYTTVCQAYIAKNWTDPNRWERRIAASPHAALIVSCWEALAGRDATASLDPALADESDFTRAEAVGLSAESGMTGLKTTPRPKNLILIVLESVGVEYLNLYGSPYETMPNLAALAARQGLIFDHVYAHCPSSPKGLVALACSTIPRCDWRLITRDDPNFDVPTLAQALAPAGVESAYLHSGYWSWKKRDDFLRQRGVQAVIDAASLPTPQVFSWGVSDRDLMAAGLRWIDERAGRPFHLMLWTIETHHPYVITGPSRDFGTSDAELNRYLNALHNSDALIADLVEQLERRGLLAETLIAVTGDHGELFGQHGQRVHSFGVYEENVHVPLVLLHPSLAAGPRRTAALCQQVDVPATLVGLMGQPLPAAWQGQDVLAHGGRERAYFFAVSNDVVLGVRQGTLKYHFHPQTGREELFDLSQDPQEQHDLAETQPALAAQLRGRVAGLVHAQRRRLAAHGAP